MGAQLPTINCATDDDFVVDFMELYSNKQGYLIGLNDQEVEGTFVWQDGSIPNYVNWKTGQPDNGTEKNCVDKRKNGKGEWHDTKCKHDRRFFCSKPAVSSCTQG